MFFGLDVRKYEFPLNKTMRFDILSFLNKIDLCQKRFENVRHSIDHICGKRYHNNIERDSMKINKNENRNAKHWSMLQYFYLSYKH